jgi:GAF domain-containing protein
MALPLISRRQVIGAVTIQSTQEAAFSDEDIAVLQTMADQLAVAIENARLFEQTQEALTETEDQARRLAALNEMNTQLSQAESLDETFRIAATQAHRIVSADRVSVALVSPTGKHAEVLALHGEAGATPVGAQVPIEGTSIDIAVRENRVVVAAVAPDSDLAEQGLRSTIVAPLAVGGRSVGTLNLGSRDPDAYTTRDENLLLQMASSLASMIENRRLVEETQDRAHREQTLRQITARVRGSTDPDAIVRTAVRELGTALGRPTFVRLGSAEELSQTPAAQAGDDDGQGMASQEGGE